MPAPLKHETKERLLAAATQLFAERGFHGTTARDIAARAGVNLASGHYHYGSKKALYLEVFRVQFAKTRALLAQRGALWSSTGLQHTSRRQLIELLHARAHAMLDLLIGPPPGVHGTLLQREMADPSEALPVIVAEFIRPMLHETEQIVARLAPQLDRRTLERCALSIIGQALFYRFTMPATLAVWGLRAYPRGTARRLAAHITDFSIGGLDRIARHPTRRGHHGR